MNHHDFCQARIPRGAKYGRTYIVRENLMMFDYRKYDHIVVKDAHMYPNVALFVKLCKSRGIGVTLHCEMNEYIRETLQHADSVMV